MIIITNHIFCIEQQQGGRTEMYKISKPGLKNQVAIVTGAAQGLGEAIARRLDLEGCKLILVDKNLACVKKVAENLNNASALKVDVTDEAQVNSMVDITMKEYGKLDILVSNAGILSAKPVIEISFEEWKKVIEINLFGYFICAKAAVKAMIPKRKGNIIQINSKSGKRGSYKNSAYAASKFGGIGFTQSLALEMAEYNIRVNAICPGNMLNSPLWINSLNYQYSANHDMTVEEVRQRYLKQIPLGRTCENEDVTNLLVFLVSEQASYITGQSINLTGGFEMN